MGTAFPLFTTPMYDHLGYHWASSLFGFIAVVMIPIPYACVLFHLVSPSALVTDTAASPGLDVLWSEDSREEPLCKHRRA